MGKKQNARNPAVEKGPAGKKATIETVPNLRREVIVDFDHPAYHEDFGRDPYPVESDALKEHRLRVAPYDLTPLNVDEWDHFEQLLQAASIEDLNGDKDDPIRQAILKDERQRVVNDIAAAEHELDQLRKSAREKKRVEPKRKMADVEVRLAHAHVVLKSIDRGAPSAFKLDGGMTRQILSELELLASSENEASADDAKRALDRFLALIRRFISSGGVVAGPDLWSMILSAFMIVQTYERARVRTLPVVLTGLKIRAGASKKQVKAMSAIEAKRPNFKEEVDRLTSDTISRPKAIKQVAEIHRVTRKTVKWHADKSLAPDDLP